MGMLFFLFKHKFFAIAVGVLLLFVVLATFSTFQPQQQSVPPTSLIPTPIPVLDQKGNLVPKVSNLQQTVIGRSTTNDAKRLYGTENKQVLPDNNVKYSIPSSVNFLPNSVITKNDVVVFEKIVTPKDKNAFGFSYISQYTATLGTPQETIQGSKVYGPHIETHVYAQKGIALVGNPNTDIVYEIHRFTPTTVENYKKLYGNDLGGHVEHTEKRVQ